MARVDRRRSGAGQATRSTTNMRRARTARPTSWVDRDTKPLLVDRRYDRGFTHEHDEPALDIRDVDHRARFGIRAIAKADQLAARAGREIAPRGRCARPHRRDLDERVATKSDPI